MGPAILVTPVLTQGADSVSGYWPPAAVWYDLWNGTNSGLSGAQTVSAPMEYLPVHVRGGYVLPRQTPAMTLAATRANPYELLIALDGSGSASGSVYVDDGES